MITHVKIRIIAGIIILLCIATVAYESLSKKAAIQTEAIVKDRLTEFKQKLVEEYGLLEWNQEEVDQFDKENATIEWEQLSKEELKLMDLTK